MVNKLFAIGVFVMYRCSVCGKRIPESVLGDAPKHLLEHLGVNAELIHEDEGPNLKYS